MTVPFVQEIIQQGLQLDADRYRALRQKFKNHEVSLELWGEYYDNQATVSGPQELDIYLDTYIACQAANVFTPKEPESVSMDALWLPNWEVSDVQVKSAKNYRTVESEGSHYAEFLIPLEMLNDEQKIKGKL